MANGQSGSDALTAPPDGFTNQAIVVTLIGANNEPYANDDSGASYPIGNALPHDRGPASSDIPRMPALGAEHLTPLALRQAPLAFRPSRLTIFSLRPTEDCRAVAGESGPLTRPGEITPEWLTDVLRSAMVIRHTSVKSVEIEEIGDIKGFLGSVVRLHPRYKGNGAGGPHSLIAKFPSADPRSRMILSNMGLYKNEIRFYSKIARFADVNVPH